jgi:hypothetical protein
MHEQEPVKGGWWLVVRSMVDCVTVDFYSIFRLFAAAEKPLSEVAGS